MRVHLTQRWRGLPEGTYDAKQTKYGIGLYSTGPSLPFQADKPLLYVSWADYNWALNRQLLKPAETTPAPSALGPAPSLDNYHTEIKVSPAAINVYRKVGEQLTLIEQRAGRTIA